MITTYVEFVSRLSSLPVPSVARSFDHPPPSLNSEDLPAMWIQLPRGSDRPITFRAGAHWPTLRADLVVAVEAVTQGLHAENFRTTISMMDDIVESLREADLVAGAHHWSIRQDIVEVAGIAYWAVVAEVEGEG